MTNSRTLALTLAGVLALTAACSGESAASHSTDVPSGPGLGKVLFLGDSIAAGEAVPMAAAFKASGASFESIAADGGGNVVGPFSDENWKKLPGQLTAANPAIVVYQLTTYDWGSREEQQAGYEKLLAAVTGTGAKLVFVTAPPIKPDDFYAPHMPELDRTPEVARAVANGAPDKAATLDATTVWGPVYEQVKDGKADRSTDGIHTCPQGAARFTTWLLGELAKLFPSFTPAAPDRWANTGWSSDANFKGC